MSCRDWVYLLSLLVPFVVYDLALKALEVAQHYGDQGFAPAFGLMRSDVLFDLGYAVLWVGLFAAVCRGRMRWLVLILFHTTAVAVVLVTTCAHQYFTETGITLSYGTIALWLPKLGEVESILLQVVPLWTWVLLLATLLYAILGPLFVTSLVERWRRGARRPSRVEASRPSVLGPIGLLLLALGFGAFSLQADSSPTGVSRTFARDPFVNVVLTGVREMTAKESFSGSDAAIANTAAKETRLLSTPGTNKRNVVLVHLESTRAQYVAPYDRLEITPFLDELADNSLVAERNYTTVPHTSKAITSVNCEIYPRLVPQNTEAEPGGISAKCLAGLLKDQGYDTVFFQSSTKDFEGRQDLVKNFGYDEFYPLESMDAEGFEKSNYFGYEDDIMLDPSERWLEGHRDDPLLATYLTGTGHHDYQCLGTSYGSTDFSEDEALNRYLKPPPPRQLPGKTVRSVQGFRALREHGLRDLRRPRGGLRRARTLPA